jgi:hypothetical protein
MQWRERAIVMAAALAARNYENDDRDEIEMWSRPILQRAAEDQNADMMTRHATDICSNPPHCGARHRCALPPKSECRDSMMLFRLATRDDAAVMTAIGSRIAEFSQFDARLPRCFTRIILVSAVRPRRRDTQAADRRAGKEYRRHLDDAIGAEQRWLEGQATEPDWPTLPIWPSRRRRGIRLGPAAREDDELTTRIAAPDVYIDEAIGTLVDHLADLGRGSVDEWLRNLAHRLLACTVRANNGPPEDGEDHDREHRPDRWNAHFFYFLGFLCGAVAFERSQPLFREPIIRLNDEAFHDALAPLLNGLDQATPLDRSGNPAQPAAVRALFAERLIRGRHWCKLAKEKSFAVEIHLGRALCAMFFHTPRMGVADPRP